MATVSEDLIVIGSWFQIVYAATEKAHLLESTFANIELSFMNKKLFGKMDDLNVLDTEKYSGLTLVHMWSQLWPVIVSCRRWGRGGQVGHGGVGPVAWVSAREPVPLSSLPAPVCAWEEHHVVQVGPARSLPHLQTQGRWRTHAVVWRMWQGAPHVLSEATRSRECLWCGLSFWEGCLELASCWSVSVDGYEIVASLAGGIFLDDVW